MAIDFGPMPNLNVQQPPAFDPLAQQQKQATLSQMLSANKLQQQMGPLQVQEQQEKAKQAQLQTQIQTMQLQGQRALSDWMQNGDANEEVPTSKFSSNDKIATYVGVAPDDPIMGVVRSMAQHHVPAPMLMAEAKSMLERRNEYYKGTQEEQAAQKNERTVWQTALAELHDTAPEQRSVALSQKLPLLQENSKTDPLLGQYAQALGGHPELIDQAYNALSAENAALGLRKAKAEAIAATPEGTAAKTGAEAQARLNVESSPQALKLASEKANIEARARQEAAQGDPAVAGKLLAEGGLTIADLKTRGTTPQFIEKATLEAQKLKPGYSPADEVIAEQVAKSQTANQFFGSANSLIAKGGTLDQLDERGKSIPNNKLPVLNSIEDWMKLAGGKGPLAGYAATALGVADDYGKVMGGGTASDHARDAALKLFAAAQSPEQRADAIKATRDAVLSQRDSRIGNNQFLKRQYGTEVSGGGNANKNTPARPSGATHTGIGSQDKKKHWLDKKGNDLGVAE